MNGFSTEAPNAPPLPLQGEQLPPGLSRMRAPPERIFLWGELPPAPWVSIVGTRRPSPVGYQSAFELARRLADEGVTVVSGGAVGIDTAAHLGALSVGGRTCVVAPVWLSVAYPIQSRAMFERILGFGGAYLTLAEAFTQPLKFAFFRRNEALMALSEATVLGECPLRSGAVNAMKHARRLNVARFVLPFSFAEERGKGSWSEGHNHAAEVLFDEQQILHSLGRPPTRARESATPSHNPGLDVPPRPGRARLSLPGEQGQVARAVQDGALTVDQVCAATGLDAHVAQYQILLLTLSGHLDEDASGLLRYQSRK